MKAHTLISTVFFTLATGAALAASEGGDTWSELQPSPSVASNRPSIAPIQGDASSMQPNQRSLDNTLNRAASEGGDTWSEVEPGQFRRPSGLPAVATTASLSTLRDAAPAPNVYGTAVTGTSADRVIQLGLDSRSFNVAYGETVRFIVQSGSGERSFI
jgi:hypothetical protein